jgi:glycosyltransferase involved in cell wall biosynthesis
VRIVDFDVTGSLVSGIRGSDQQRYVDFVVAEASRSDVLLNFGSPHGWTCHLLADVLGSLPCKKVLQPVGYIHWGTGRLGDYFDRLPETLRQYDLLLYHSADGREAEYSRRYQLPHYVVLPLGADEEEFDEPKPGFRAKYGVKTPHMLLCVANYVDGKRYDFVLEAFGHLARSDAELVTIGEPWAASLLLRSVRRRAALLRLLSLGRKRVHVLTGVSRADVISAYQAADLFLFASDFESGPLVLVEAMASATPFLSTDVGMAKDLRGGRIVSNAAEMAKEANRLLGDEVGRRRLGEEGRAAWRSRYTWRHLAGELEQIYLGLVAGMPISELQNVSATVGQ